MEAPSLGPPGAQRVGLSRDKRRSLVVTFLGVMALAVVALHCVSTYEARQSRDALQDKYPLWSMEVGEVNEDAMEQLLKKAGLHGDSLPSSRVPDGRGHKRAATVVIIEGIEARKMAWR